MFPTYPLIQASEKPLEGEDTQYIGEVAEQYLKKFATKGEADTTYGLYDRKGNFYIGNKPVVIVDNNIMVDGEEYEGAPGLWELLISKYPDDTIYNAKDEDNYTWLMIKTNSLHRGYDPNSRFPRGSDCQKWNKFLSKIWYGRKKNEGKGVEFILSDPSALLERLDLLIASQEAGSTGVRNELVSICNESKRQGVLDTRSYKKLNSVTKKC